MELSDPKLQHLQQRYMKALIAIGGEIDGIQFPYPFYLSRTLDVDAPKMRDMDQRSIRFDSYQHQTVLSVTGNYYASYSADLMDPHARLKETFNRVVLPILRTEVTHFPDDSEFAAFAVEVSHHVRRKVMGLKSENPENVAVIIPVMAAQKLVDAKNDDQRQAAVLEAEVLLNGQPYSLWLQDGKPTEEWKESHAPVKRQVAQPAPAPTPAANASAGNASLVSASLMNPAASQKIFTPESLAVLQRQNQDAIDRMVKGLDKQIQFLPYAPPSIVAFRHGAYLQLTFNSSVDTIPGASRYKLAALAFDDHVSHVIRPLLDYFPADVNFDGINLSALVKPADGSKVQAVEFFLPMRMMRCYGSYDCTGQQLLDSGTVLINGERVALDLQVAEGKN
jgi:hypothetical protein